MTDQERESLWTSYFENPDQETRNKITIEYLPLVRGVASRMMHFFAENSVEYDDLVSYGIFGLIDAINKFDKNMNVKFETYTSLRIRGSIIDQIRKLDWVPRLIRNKQKKVEKAKRTLLIRGVSNPTNAQIAAELGISENEYIEWEVSFIPSLIECLDEPVGEGESTRDDFIEQSRFSLPERQYFNKELKNELYEALELLSEKQRQAILLYYFDEQTMKEVSNTMGVSQSRVFQLTSSALTKMKKKLGSNAGFLFW